MKTENPRIAKTPLTTVYGEFELFVFSWSSNEQDNILVLKKTGFAETPTVRVQSACYTGEIFESVDCDCHWQLESGLKKISESGGYFIYMLQDGRGAGLLTKIKGMSLSAREGVDTAQAYEAMGVNLDPREYSRPAWILNHFDVQTIRLLTNNPRKVSGLESHGIRVVREAHESVPTEGNSAYLKAKRVRLGHLLRQV